MIRLKSKIGKYYYEETKRALPETFACEILDEFELKHYYHIKHTNKIILLKEDCFQNNRYLPPTILLKENGYYKIEFI